MAQPVRNDQGEITRWFGTSTDIHDAYVLSQEREEVAREMMRLVTQDHLTGVLTRRAFVDGAKESLQRTRLQGKPSSVLMLDIDYFKSVNDTYGHPGGDKVLATTAKRMKAALKQGDLIGRLGGEEFAVLLPDCTESEAREVAERVRQTVEEHPIALDGGVKVRVTVSIGVTTSTLADKNLDRLFNVADKALYQAKRAGRNKSFFLDELNAHKLN